MDNDNVTTNNMHINDDLLNFINSSFPSSYSFQFINK